MLKLETYGSLSDNDLRTELVEVSRHLSYLHHELGSFMAEHHKTFLKEYVKSPGGSVAAKNREAEFQTSDIMAEIIGTRAQINELTIGRDLIIFLLLSRAPNPLEMFPPATMDEAGLLSA